MWDITLSCRLSKTYGFNPLLVEVITKFRHDVFMNKCTLLFCCFALLSCTKKIYLQTIDFFLNADTVEEKSKFMAENYRSFFEEKKGDGKDKQNTLKSFANWDGPMHPQVEILNYSVNGKIWTVHFNEKNDFARLIGYPGWKGTAQISFNSKKLISEFIYIPDSSNSSYTPYLQPALDWLQQNMPDQLAQVYQDKRLVKTQESAKKWILLLTLWKEKTK